MGLDQEEPTTRPHGTAQRRKDLFAPVEVGGDSE
jgi:hypothetical protein